MKFRPCIDIHNGQVKQIVGSSLTDQKDQAKENFVASQDAAWFAEKYKNDGLKGGHVILLNAADSPWFSATREQAVRALAAYPGGLQVGGGVNETNAAAWLKAGASHVIVTSYVFAGGTIRYDRLKALNRAVGKEHLVLDLSCRRRGDDYYVVTDRWQTFTEEKVTVTLLEELAGSCDEFLIHGVDVEGKGQGMEVELLQMLSGYRGVPLTYAGGVRALEDLELLRRIGEDRIDVTVGSALDLFGGRLPYDRLIRL
ncbi:MAG: phosphoribosylformimino-5-aminoimidazole carboxamide ribotide isomerase [Lachnospiraceae bacterium]|nr:phosphoribosylformimino-5-aminoimidazole carboxamide ribotide isomerase [Lachnospiraceae bacterium]